MINLLPLKQKEEFFEERKMKILINFGFLIVFFIIFLGILLFSVEIYLTAATQEQKFLLKSLSSSIVNPKYQELEGQVLESNKLISQLNDFYGTRADITQILEKISNIMPAGVNLVNFSYQKKTSIITLRGKANTRDNFLIFKNALESQKEVINLSSPVSNLLKSADIDFYFSFNLNK